MNEESRILRTQKDVPVTNDRVMATREQKFYLDRKTLQIFRFPNSHLQCVGKTWQ